MKLIALSSTKKTKHSGKYFAQVDDEDYDFLMQWDWQVTITKNSKYAIRFKFLDTKRTGIYMHRVIVGDVDKNMEVDHIDHNGLNNQKGNLRIATSRQNQYNKRKNKGVSKYRGVCAYTKFKNNLWQASICVNGTQKHLGGFKTEHEAALAYDEAAKKYFGDFANLNFPK